MIKPARHRRAAERIRGLDLREQRRATQREQSIVRKAAKRRTQHRGERDLVSLVVEETKKLDEIGDLFALIEAAAEHGLIRNIRATKDRFVDLHLGRRAKQQRDLAVLELGVRTLQGDDAARDLL